MQPYLDQAKHNQAFHDQIHQQYPDDFFDWKITILFYVAIHLLKALASQRGANIGQTHEEIGRNIKPVRSGQRPEMPISESAYANYYSLYSYSRVARYTGMNDPSTFQELMREDHQRAEKRLRDFRLYIEGSLK